MSSLPLIFISAVSRELRSGRQLAANTLTFLGYQPIWQEIFGTETGDLRAMLRQQIDQPARDKEAPVRPAIGTDGIAVQHADMDRSLDGCHQPRAGRLCPRQSGTLDDTALSRYPRRLTDGTTAASQQQRERRLKSETDCPQHGELQNNFNASRKTMQFLPNR